VCAGRRPGRCAQPVRPRPRPGPGRRPGGGAQVQGNLRPACRSLQFGRGAARSDGPGRPRLPGTGLRPARRHRRRRRGRGRAVPRTRCPGLAGVGRCAAVRRRHGVAAGGRAGSGAGAAAGGAEFLSRGQRAGTAARAQPRPAAASQQGHGDGVMATQALVNGRVLLDDGFHDDVAVLLDGSGRIQALVPEGQARIEAGKVRDLGGGWLLPGFIDVQVNGGGGVLFNNDTRPEAIDAIGRAHRRYGTTSFLPTLISDTAEVMERAIAGTREAIAAGVPGVLGIHLEGPYLAPARKGTHDAARFRVPDAAELAMATSLDNGVTLVTLAPEQVPADAIRAMVARGAIVCAGHTAGTYEQIRAGLEAGVRGFTHLYNAMSPLQGREPGTVGAALESREAYCGMIVDGVHVHPASLRVALAAKP